MRCQIAWVAAIAIALANAANAASITVVPSTIFPRFGSTVTLTIYGDPQGGQAAAIFGTLDYSPEMTSTVTSSQSRLTRAGGTILAITGVLTHGDGFVDVFNQIIDFGGRPRTVDNILIATATLIANRAGPIVIRWSTGPGLDLDFFGLTSANTPAIAAVIYCCPEVPEPGTAGLLGLGLLALAAMARWRMR